MKCSSHQRDEREVLSTFLPIERHRTSTQGLPRNRMANMMAWYRSLNVCCVALLMLQCIHTSFHSAAQAFVVTTTTSLLPKRPAVSSCTLPSLSSSSSSSSSVSLNAVKIEGYDNAMRIIDACAVRGTPSDDLYDAVRFMDKRALQIYPNLQHKQDLWQRAHGSWKLQLATGGGKYRTFKPIPIFAFAVIDEKNFGNGIGFNPNFILFSLLGPHIFRDNIRQMVITIDDVFLGGSSVTSWAPGFVQDAMGIGKRKQQEPAEEKPKTRPPAFTMIAASDKALVARGGSGGIAIWSRLDKDIRPAAYKHRT